VKFIARQRENLWNIKRVALRQPCLSLLGDKTMLATEELAGSLADA
jgi:hypothetical protein